MNTQTSIEFIQSGMSEPEKSKFNNDRKKVLQKTAHNFWNDPGHGWLEVEISDLSLLGIKHQISGYSYQKDDKAYLEEDCDATKYLKALFGDLSGYSYANFRDNCIIDCYRENIFIRNLPHYKK